MTYAVDLATSVLSLVALVEMLCTTLGNAVAALAGVHASVVSGGALCVLGGAAPAIALPRFWPTTLARHRRAAAGHGRDRARAPAMIRNAVRCAVFDDE